MRSSLVGIFIAVLLFVSGLRAQQADVTITLNEQFFDALLDSIFEHGGPPEIPIAGRKIENKSNIKLSNSFISNNFSGPCTESLKLLRENQAVRTAVRFREGKIYMPIAFSGGYNPPLIGCVDFGGYAESNIDLEFDKASQRLIGRVTVLNVVLNGTAGIGSSVVTKMVQSAIDRRLNPLEIIKTEKLSITLPMQNSPVRMEAAGIRTEIVNNTLQIHVDYVFPK
ncbi:MAG: hypothetical protein ABI999_04105 [Acidobacteriota bacterium]